MPANPIVMKKTLDPKIGHCGSFYENTVKDYDFHGVTWFPYIEKFIICNAGSLSGRNDKDN
ncbi:hypothetical protein X777_01986 [Ooceraea biroi]|uniref:Uncharacterized protein n=1 Tax=Ooceraea biroi TaxID=2015173 RepID=A0A026WQL5_OOCBI|nr:hypothetical protein X777_01986 [Ooceraea biroi]